MENTSAEIFLMSTQCDVLTYMYMHRMSGVKVYTTIQFSRDVYVAQELCDEPLMFDEEGASRLDVNQGVLGQ